MSNNSLISCIIDYVEDNLLNDFSLNDLEKHMGISKNFLIKMFHAITEYTIFEYIRNRRLYLAALDIINSDDKIADISAKYIYKTPECFTRAFKARYGYSPRIFRERKPVIKKFLSLNVKIIVSGGDK